MRVLRTIESFYPFVTGPANQAFNISKRLFADETEILTSDYKAKKLPPKQRYENVQVHRFPIITSLMSYHYTPAMKKYLIKTDFDLIHAHNYRSYQTEIAYLAARKKNKPLVLSVHGSLTGYKTSLPGAKRLPYWLYDKAARKKILDYAKAIIVNSRQEYDRAVKFGISRDKLKIIPVGIDKKPQVSYTKKKKLRLLFVGNISRNRNLEAIIKAMKLLENYELRVVGGELKSSKALSSGYVDELKALAARLGVTDRIQFAGPKYKEELEQEYLRSDIFVYTSISENFGQTIIEAAAHGLPVMCTPVGIAPELLDKEWIVRPGPKMIAAKTEKAAQMRRQIGTQLRKRVQADYSWGSIIGQYKSLYEKLT